MIICIVILQKLNCKIVCLGNVMYITYTKYLPQQKKKNAEVIEFLEIFKKYFSKNKKNI